MEEGRQYLDLFLGEVKEHLSKLNELVLFIERHPKEKEAIEEAFREMHTIKGDSATVGLKDIAHFAHEAEDLLSGLRSGSMEADAKTINALFRYLDKIAASVEAAGEGRTWRDDSYRTDPTERGGVNGGEPMKIKELERALEIVEKGVNRASETLKEEERELLSLSSKENPVEEEAWAGQSSRKIGIDGLDKAREMDNVEQPCVSVGINPEKDAVKYVHAPGILEYDRDRPGRFVIKILNEIEPQLRPLRAFIILKILFEAGDLVRTDPPNEKLVAGDFGEEITAEVITRDIKSTAESLRGVPGVKGVEYKKAEGTGALGTEKPLAEKSALIDKLVSLVETEEREDASARIKVDSVKGKYKVEEIRVNINSLDRLFNLSGELVLAKSRLGNLAKQIDSPEMKDVQRFIEGVVSELQNEVMGLRLMPIGQVFGIFPRMVRDMSKSLGKEVDLIIEGGDTAVDRKIVEELVDAIVHLVRNCVDHGIEAPDERVRNGKQAVGTIRLSATRDSSHFILEIQDDGKGMSPKEIRETAVAGGLVTEKKALEMDDEEVLYLTCVPGFSTKKCVSEISGRGMGMSAVKSKIEAYGGSFSICSKAGKGTKFTIRMPASMATMKVVVIGVGRESHLYAIPVADVSEIVEIQKEEIRFIQGAPYINLRGDIIRLYRLAWLLKIEEDVCDSYFAIIIKRSEGRNFGLLVSEIRDEDEVAIKPVPKLLRGVSGFIGSTILGDGKPAFVLDVMTIV